MFRSLKRSAAVLLAASAMVSTVLITAPVAAYADDTPHAISADVSSAPVGSSVDVTLSGVGLTHIDGLFFEEDQAGYAQDVDITDYTVNDDSSITVPGFSRSSYTDGFFFTYINTQNQNGEPYRSSYQGPEFNFYNAPNVSVVSPSNAFVNGGNTVTVTGTDFQRVDHVSLDNNDVTNFSANTDGTQLTFTMPALVAATYNLELHYNNDQSVVADTVITVTDPGGNPAVLSMDPGSSTVLGGTISLVGANFNLVNQAYLQYTGAISFNVIDDSHMTFEFPAGNSVEDYSYTVQLFTAQGIETDVNVPVAAQGPAPHIDSITPIHGPASGTDVDIYGSNFVDVQAVFFDTATEVPTFTVLDSTHIHAHFVAAGNPGTGSVKIKALGGDSNNVDYTADDDSAPEPNPTITSQAPTSGPVSGGTKVTLTGTQFGDITAVTMDGQEVPVTIVSPTELYFVTPPLGNHYPVQVLELQRGEDRGFYFSNTFTYILPPAVTSLSPDSGSSAGGNTVTVTGSGFTGATAVSFGSHPAASFAVVSDTSITAVAPAVPGVGATAGSADLEDDQVTVTAPSGTSAIDTSGQTTKYRFNQPNPAITSQTPTSGPAGGGTKVTLTGTQLGDITAVTMDGQSVPVVIVSSTELYFITPALAVGLNAQQVIELQRGPSRGFYFNNTFTYVLAPAVTSLSPKSGPSTGGTTVTITGTGFTGATAVNFGGHPAVSFTVVSDTSITAVAGPVTAIGATVDSPTYEDDQVTVVAPSGTSPLDTSAAQKTKYTFNQPNPTITSVTPASGPAAGGTKVTLTGTQFANITAVSLGGHEASVTAVSAGQLYFFTPPVGGNSAVQVLELLRGESRGFYFTNTFTYLPAPSVASLSPTSGSSGGGNTVTITGAGFSGATAVMFGSHPVTSFRVVSDTSITAVAPAVPAVGAAVTAPTFEDDQITVVSPNGTSAVDASGTTTKYTFNQPNPTISSESPTSGSVLGGTKVVLNGTQLGNITAVTMNGQSVPATIVSPTQLFFITPPLSAGQQLAQVLELQRGESRGFYFTNTFTYISAPTLTKLSAVTGLITGGTTITITGTNFTGATAVNFGSVPAVAFSVRSATSIVATVPAATVAGPVNITVTTASGPSASPLVFTYNYPTPVASSISPNTGSGLGGTHVVITGSNFAHVNAVTFGNAVATFTVVSDTEVDAIAPAGTGSANVVLSAGSVSSRAMKFAYIPAPTVTGINTTSGLTSTLEPQDGGRTVTVRGSGFTSATEVDFGATPGTNLNVVSATSITVTAPAHARGVVDVTVKSANGTSPITNADRVTYVYNTPVIATLTPNRGGLAGGTQVVITGSGFAPVNSVKFGATVATSFTVVSDTEVDVVSPTTTTAGAVNVVLSNGETSTASSLNQFTYVAGPAVTSINTTSGLTSTLEPMAGGRPVTIRGTGFTGATEVDFGTLPGGNLVVGNSTSITVTAPAQARGVVDVTVKTPYGTSAAVAADRVTYVYNTPTIATITPNAGALPGGTNVVITGSGFGPTSSVKFGNVAATSFVVVSDREIDAISPAVTTAGAVSVVVSNGETSTATSLNQFTYVAPPAVISINTTSGLTSTLEQMNGGRPVTIRGTGFSGATEVDFGTTPGSNLVVNSSTQITVVAPAHARGVVDVTVKTPFGTSSVVAGDKVTYIYNQPTIASMSPSSGSVAGGTKVIIKGTNLTPTNSVKFGSATATSFVVVSDTEIDAISPATTAAGAVNVVVSNGESSTITSQHLFTYKP